MNTTITLQNRSPYAKALADQASGQRPLYLGPSRYGQHSSADLSVDQFLAYFGLILGYTTRKRQIDGNACLMIISDQGAFEISPQDLLQGMADGKLGAEWQAKASAFVAERAEQAAAMVEWQKTKAGMLSGAALRASAQL